MHYRPGIGVCDWLLSSLSMTVDSLTIVCNSGYMVEGSKSGMAESSSHTGEESPPSEKGNFLAANKVLGGSTGSVSFKITGEERSSAVTELGNREVDAVGCASGVGVLGFDEAE